MIIFRNGRAQYYPSVDFKKDKMSYEERRFTSVDVDCEYLPKPKKRFLSTLKINTI